MPHLHEPARRVVPQRGRAAVAPGLTFGYLDNCPRAGCFDWIRLSVLTAVINELSQFDRDELLANWKHAERFETLDVVQRDDRDDEGDRGPLRM